MIMIVTDSKIRSIIRESLGPALAISALQRFVRNTAHPMPYRFFINYLLGSAGIKNVDNKLLSPEQELLIKEAAIAFIRYRHSDELVDDNVKVISTGMQTGSGIFLAADEGAPMAQVARSEPGSAAWTIQGQGQYWEFENSLRLVGIEYNKESQILKITDVYDFNTAEDAGYNFKDVISNIVNSFPGLPSSMNIHNAVETFARGEFVKKHANEFNVEFTFENVKIEPVKEDI